jgi:threonine dehydratase
MTSAADRPALPDLAAIRAAAARIAPHVVPTPVLRSDALDALAGALLHFKCENLQKVGAFKARGACNAVFALDAAEAAHGVVTHSSGNHGAALAFAARARGIPAYIVMPDNAPAIKVANVERYGGQVHFCTPTVPAREAACAALQRQHGATLIHPFDNAMVIAGAATVALELLEQHADLDAVIAPCGGGGLMSGTAIAAKAMKPSIRVYGAEPANAGDAAASFRSGHIEPVMPTTTIADGLRTALLPRTFNAIRAHVDDLCTCSEGAIVAAMRLMWERLKVVVEPSSAVPLACVLEKRYPIDGMRVGIIVSGGNVDLDRLPWQALE